MDTKAWYVLVNRNSGKALDVAGVSSADGAALTQWARIDGTNQQFRFVDSGDGYYRLKARHSGKLLDVAGWSTADNAAIHQWSDHGDANQQFRLANSPDGYVRLINRNSGKAVEVPGFSSADGTGIVQYSDGGGANQQWKLVRVGFTGLGSCWHRYPVQAHRNSPCPLGKRSFGLRAPEVAQPPASHRYCP